MHVFYRMSLPSGILEIICRLTLNRKVSETTRDATSAIGKHHHTTCSPPNPGKKVGYRDQDHELTKDRYDHAVYCFSESLKYCSADDTEPGDQIMNPDDTQCRYTVASISSEALNIPRRTCGISSKDKNPTKVRQKAVIRLSLIVLIIRFLF